MLTRRVWPSRPAFENAWNDSDQLRRELLRLIEGQPGELAAAGVFPPINVTQDEDNFYVRAEVPGTKASELSISAQGNRLSIAGKREIPQEHGRVSYHRRERAEGAFNRILTLPSELDTEHIEARYSDGVLTLKVPRAASAKPRQITVQT
ncbi:MAG: hypothetical protein RL701_3284 [Pseudomonadota bacterium]|jgi:HSP20 family protein